MDNFDDVLEVKEIDDAEKVNALLKTRCWKLLERKTDSHPYILGRISEEQTEWV